MKRDDLAFDRRDDAPPSASFSPLRLFTAGSVDDGKSTLIGRLLLDSQALLADQIDALRARAGGEPLDLSLVTDGLEAEREQGITIDVAHRYFATPTRKFIIADAPGHEQYTRNMVTAAAGSDAAVVLVDATKLQTAGVAAVALLPQTRRHALIARLLGVAHIVFAVNKLDAVAEPDRVYARIRTALIDFSRHAGIALAGLVPISALHGDNVTLRSRFVGYDGPTLLGLLETLPAAADGRSGDRSDAVLPVQFVDAAGRDDTPSNGARPRVLWGRVASGRLVRGDALCVWPSGERAHIAELHDNGGRAETVAAGRSAGVVLDRPLDVSRGDWLAAPGALRAGARFDATLAWLDTEPAVANRKYLLRHGNRWLQARLASIESRIDIATLAARPADRLAVNDIGAVVVETQAPIPLRPFAEHRALGSLIVVDPATHRTSGVLLVS